jgi:hypothetical protein
MMHDNNNHMQYYGGHKLIGMRGTPQIETGGGQAAN